MSNITEYAKKLTPSVYLRLKQSVETGKWEDGQGLSEEQREHTLQLVLAYQSLHNDSPEHFTVAKGGEIYMEKKSVLKSQFSEPYDDDLHQINL